jgi:hypothetical protein
MSYIILRGRWFHINVLNGHIRIQDKTKYEGRLYEEFEC